MAHRKGSQSKSATQKRPPLRELVGEEQHFIRNDDDDDDDEAPRRSVDITPT
jgi:hypothetical protein